MKKHGPWDDRTPKTKYRMMWGGSWRPVLQMFDAGHVETTLPLRAVQTILYAEKGGEGSLVVTACGPADILITPGYRTADWDVVY